MNTDTRQFQLNGKTISISVKNIDADPDFVLSAKFRKEIILPHLSIQPSLMLDRTEFFENIEFLITKLQGKQLDKHALGNALDAKCQEHIREFGRLIDNDLEGYIDCLMFLSEACSKVFYNHTFLKEEGESLRQEYVDAFFKRFYNYIWVNQRESTAEFPFTKSKIVKLSELGNNRH